MLLIESKLTKRYFLITLIVILIVLSSVCGFTITVMNSSFRDQIRYRDELLARTLAKRVDFTLKKMVNEMRASSHYTGGSLGDDNRFYAAEMQKILVREPLYHFIQSIDAQGRPISRVPEARTPQALDLGAIAYRLSWSKTFYVSDLFELPDGEKTIAIAYPVLDEPGHYRGGVIAFVNLATLSGYLRESKIGKEGMVALIDRGGTVIAHSDESRIGESLREHPLGGFLKKERFGIWEGSLFEKKAIVAYRPLSTGTFGLIVGETLSQAWAPSDHVTAVLLQGFMAVLLVALAMNLYGTSRVVKPILSLIRQAQEYKENRRTSFDPISSRDEIEELSLTMDQMAQALRERERRLFYILEAIPYGVVTIDRDGRITTFNRGAEELTGYRREEVAGKPIIELPLKSSREEFLTWRTLKEGKEFEEVETYILDKAQQRHDVRLHSALFRGEDDKLLGALLVLRDVGELKKLEDYVRQSERLASLGKLTAGIAHEIKNPLSIIHAAAEAILLEVREQDGTDYVTGLAGDILTTTERMDSLLQDFLSLSKDTERGNRQELNLVPILDELLQLLRKRIAEQDIRIVRHYETDTALVLGNRNRLVQVFLNILLNSLQAMDQGGRLAIALQQREGCWEVAFEDTGKGIPAAKMQWIFNPFFSTKHDGTGLGLSIAYEVIAEHDGKIWATSTEGVGTTLFIQIPQLLTKGSER